MNSQCRDDVMNAARVLDPEAGTRRKARRFERRMFYSPVSSMLHKSALHL